jgi:hypothetical protein
MHDGVHAMFRQQCIHQLAVTHVSHHQRRAVHGLAEAGRQVVEHHHALAARDQLQHGVAADIAGAARDQDRGSCHFERFTRGFSGRRILH